MDDAMDDSNKMDVEQDLVTNATSSHERRRCKVSYFYKPDVAVSPSLSTNLHRDSRLTSPPLVSSLSPSTTAQDTL